MVLLDISFPETCLECPLRVGFTCAPVQGDSHLNRARLGGTERPEKRCEDCELLKEYVDKWRSEHGSD